MDWGGIWKKLQAVFGHLNDPTHWKVSKNDKSGPTVTGVDTGPDHGEWTVDDNGVTITLRAQANPKHPKYADVYVNGTLDPKARLVGKGGFQFPKGIFVALTFRPVGGADRWRFDIPK